MGFLLIPLSLSEDALQQYWLLSYEPYLVRQAAENGIWPGDASSRDPDVRNHMRPSELYEQCFQVYGIVHQVNPYYQRGDFDGDGEIDIAVTIREKANWRTGLAIIPATLDTVFIFGADQPFLDGSTRMDVTALFVPANGFPEPLIVGFGNGSQVILRWSNGGFHVESLTESEPLLTEPALVRKAIESGLWPEGIHYEILTDWNPYYLRGDFNGDGEMDVAVQVRDTSNREKGLVIVHSSLDTLHAIFRSTVGRGPIANASFIRVIRKGTEIRPFSEDRDKRVPFTLVGDALEASWRGPYSGAFYWKDGAYRWITLSD